ncbi:MAG: M1 family metallopeptidase [Candidatus Saccharicenans sp.]|nr:M1 family metallopeptidase [Candidatus Saccharicenans sp.]
MKKIKIRLGTKAFLVLTALFFGLILAGRAQDRHLVYDLKVELLTETAMLNGQETIVWTNITRDYVPDIWFHLYWNAFKNELSTMAQEARREKMFSRYRAGKDDWGWIKITSLTTASGKDLMPAASFISPDEPHNPHDQTVLRVELPEPLAPGQTITLNIDFQAKVPRNGLRTGYYKDGFFIAQWFPKPGVYEEGRGWNCHEYHLNSEFFADFADFRVEITVPSRMVVGACGQEVEKKEDPASGKTTYTYVGKNIHDFAWTASPRFIKVERWFRADEEVTPEEYQKMAEILGLTPEEIKLPDVRMILLIEKQHQKQIERHFKALRAAIKYYGLWYGPYPYPTITMVDPPFRTGSGGMEYPTLFTAGTSVILEKEVLSPEQVIVHEFGHGYWYGMVANNEFEEAWLDEGINTYSTGRVTDLAYGPGRLPVKFNGWPLNWLIKTPAVYDWQLGRVVSNPVATLDPIVTESWKFYNSMSYSMNVYYRAATALHTLERLLGEKTWSRIMRAYHLSYRFRHPKTENFMKVVNEVSGQNLSWFFEEFFISAKDFDCGIASVETRLKPEKYRGIFDDLPTKNSDQGKEQPVKKPSSRKEKIYQTTITLRRYGQAKPAPAFPLKLKVEFEDGSTEWRAWDAQSRWARFDFEKPARVKTACLDPEGLWLVDSNLANNSYSSRGPGASLQAAAGSFIWMMQNFLLTLFGLL